MPASIIFAILYFSLVLVGDLLVFAAASSVPFAGPAAFVGVFIRGYLVWGLFQRKTDAMKLGQFFAVLSGLYGAALAIYLLSTGGDILTAIAYSFNSVFAFLVFAILRSDSAKIWCCQYR